MPRAKRRKKVLIHNLTHLKLRIYYRATNDSKLEVAALIFPKEDELLDALHTKAIIGPGKIVLIPLRGDWGNFNGIVFDTTRIKQVCLGTSYATYLESSEYVLTIKLLTN